MQSRSAANKCSLTNTHRGPVFGGKMRIKPKPESLEAKEKMWAQSPREVCSVSRGEHERWRPATACLTPGNLTAACLLVTNRNSLVAYLSRRPRAGKTSTALSFFTSDDISSDPLPLKGFFPHLHTSPLCLLCFNLIINSNVSLHENFLFQIRPRDEVLPFILPGEWYITETTPSLEYIKAVGSKTLSHIIPLEQDYELSLQSIRWYNTISNNVIIKLLQPCLCSEFLLFCLHIFQTSCIITFIAVFIATKI